MEEIRTLLASGNTTRELIDAGFAPGSVYKGQRQVRRQEEAKRPMARQSLAPRTMATGGVETLAKHVQKGVTERAHLGWHLGGVPFGYLPCSLEDCDPEHPGGVHVIEHEGAAVREMLKRYAAGSTTTVHLAAWLNGQGHRTRNRHRLEADQAQPRLFTVSSVRGILHNAFYTGQVKHREGLVPGAHKPLISQDVFEHVQHLLQRNSGRSRTLTSHPQREYLLKGLVRCAQCGMPMWAQTFKNGRAYYREHRGSRGVGACTDMERSIPCQLVDDEVGRIVASITLPPDWLEQVLERINLRDEVARVRQGRQQVQKKMRRLAKAYMDSLVDEDDYERQKLRYEMELESLVVPEADAVAEAGRLVERLPELWAAANVAERRKLLMTVLDAVYVDAGEGRAVASIRPKAALAALLIGLSTRAAWRHATARLPVCPLVCPVLQATFRLFLIFGWMLCYVQSPVRPIIEERDDQSKRTQ